MFVEKQQSRQFEAFEFYIGIKESKLPVYDGDRTT